MNPASPDPSSPAPAATPGATPPAPAPGDAAAEPDPNALTPEEQLARYADALKESDWGHQPC